MKVVSIRDIHIGIGIPKIIVPLIGRTIEELLLEIKSLQTNFEIIEWRADFLEGIEDITKVKKTLSTLREVLYPTPLLFTFRTHREGGNKIIEDILLRNPSSRSDENKRS